jgi:hypothetical protein
MKPRHAPRHVEVEVLADPEVVSSFTGRISTT